MNIPELVMLTSAGLFAGGALTFAWSRVPIWRRMPLPQFSHDFAQTLRWTDKIQPALLLTSIASAATFAISADGAAATLAALGAATLVLTLLTSLTALVPLQRRIIAMPVEAADAVEAMRLLWFRRNLVRSAVATASFALVAAAAAA